MNFFATQERSLRNTRKLILLMTLAVITVVASVTALFSTRMFFRLGAALGLNSSTDSPIYLRLGTAF